jgi:hypothetical protein
VIARDHTRLATKTSENKAEGRIKVESATLRWLEDVESDSGEPKLKRQKTNDGEDRVRKVLTAPYGQVNKETGK